MEILNQGKKEKGTASQRLWGLLQLHREMSQFWDWDNIMEVKEKGRKSTLPVLTMRYAKTSKCLGSTGLTQPNWPEASARFLTSWCCEFDYISGQTQSAFYSLVWAQVCNSLLLRMLGGKKTACSDFSALRYHLYSEQTILAAWMCAGNRRRN